MKILLATDGSECARAAVDFLYSLPFPAGSELTVLTVLETELLGGEESTQLSDEQHEALRLTEQMLRQEGQQMLAREAARLQGLECGISTRLGVGHPAAVITDTAVELGADLVVVGSRGLNSVKRFLIGSVSDHVLKYAHCSVLIFKPRSAASVPAGAAAHGLNILLAYDDSGPARKAVDLCASLRLGANAVIRIVTVLPLITFYRQDIRQRLSGVWRDKKRLAGQALERLRDEVSWPTPDVSVALKESADVSREVLDTAAALGSDLILLGHKGRGAIEQFLLGSVTARIAHHAPCSVLAVR
jgi:nucleotide-binding universal stress UspA family protein